MAFPKPVVTIASSIRDLPGIPAVYALYGGRGRSRHVAYVGVGGSLRGRIDQHLVRRDSSVATGVSAASLNPDHVTAVEWWTRDDFADKDALHAAELVAFDVLSPALRSRGGIQSGAKRLYDDEAFRTETTTLFENLPVGRLTFPTLTDALNRIRELEERLKAVERQLRKSPDA